jgi:hypothetical protein
MNRADAVRVETERAFILKCPFHSANIHIEQPSVVRRIFSHLAVDSPGTDVALSIGNNESDCGGSQQMSIVTALSIVLVVGFFAAGLVGFLGWRKRMREGAGSHSA